MTANATVATLATERPHSVRVLQRHGIDFCCGGQRTLDDACAQRGITADILLTEVADEEARALPSPRRWDDAPLPELVDYLLVHHHRPLDSELPRLSALINKVCSVHHDRDPERFDALRSTWRALIDDVIPHMAKEEQVLFPWITAGNGADAGGPIQVMEEEHIVVGALLAQLRRLTDNYQAPAEACGSWRALWSGLEALEADLHTHIHLENNVLFPRALQE